MTDSTFTQPRVLVTPDAVTQEQIDRMREEMPTNIERAKEVLRKHGYAIEEPYSEEIQRFRDRVITFGTIMAVIGFVLAMVGLYFMR